MRSALCDSYGYCKGGWRLRISSPLLFQPESCPWPPACSCCSTTSRPFSTTCRSSPKWPPR
ncbi:hypothetical protein C0063_19585, partial [Pseudoxanthomonas sp. KAs_5_3]